jgi:uncharacterized membrane protein
VIQNTIVVDRPIEAVFDYASHFERHPEWQPDLKAADFHGPAQVGAAGTETRQMGPRVHTYQWRVSAYEPPNRLGFETISGPMRPAGTMRFRSEGEATRVDFEMALNPRGLMKLLAPVIERQVQKANTGHLALFKQRLEADSS